MNPAAVPMRGAYRQFMAARGIDASSSPRAVDAALTEYDRSLRKPVSGTNAGVDYPYHRFSYSEPGAALRDAGASGSPYWSDPISTASNFYDTAMATDPRRARFELRRFTSNAANNPLLNANRERDPNIATRWMRTTVPLERKLPGGPVDKAKQWFMENAPNAKTPEQKANAWDAYARMLQFKNQLPPRGITSSLAFKLATLAAGAAFGGGILQNMLISKLGGAALIPAINIGQGIKNAVDIGRGIRNPDARGP